MLRRILLLASVCACAGPLWAQDISTLQIHGFATQGFLYSSNNNYLSTNSSAGSFAWTDGALSFSNQVSDKLRVGIQVHMYQLGQFGDPTVQVDWATGDYKINEHFGFRAGKFKVPLGLYNDSQDVDAVHLWALLPQSVYPTDNRSFMLAALGGEFYGNAKLGRKGGTVVYRSYAGYRTLDLNGGYVKALDLDLEYIDSTFGLPTTLITSAPMGNVFGGDVRWQAPLRGLLLGMSAIDNDVQGSAGPLSFAINRTTSTQEYAKFERGKFLVAGEVRRVPVDLSVSAATPSGTITLPNPLDWRSWYVMTSYRFTGKFQAGTYYSHFVDAGGGQNTGLIGNYSKDWTVSGRYDFDAYFYGKIEEHFVHGLDLGYYSDSNPNGLQPRTNVLAAKIGFSF